jgi:hypothetical protein
MISDSVACLHPQGRLRLMLNSTTADDSSDDCSEVRPGFYTTHDPDDDQIDDDDCESLGFGDFLAFNSMLLALLPPDFSIHGKCLMVVTYMISVYIGHESTRQLGHFWNAWMMPAIPVPMFFISLYASVLNYIVDNASSVCPPESN